MMKMQKEETSTIDLPAELVDKLVDNMAEAIIAVLRSSSRSKFADAARLCQIGQNLMRTQAKRVQDFALLEVEDQAMNMNVGYAQGGGVVAYGDDRAAQREFMLTFGPNAQIHAEAQRASVASQEAAELSTLNNLRSTLPEAQRGPLDARIQRLIDNMEARNNVARKPDVVPADVPRRHPAGEGGAEVHPPEGVRADLNGAEGHGGAAFACRIDETLGEAVGQG